MSTIMDYLDWRGDLPLSVSPFNEVDNLLLAELSFVDFSGIVPAFSQHRSGISLREAAIRYRAMDSKPTEMGLVVPPQIPSMMEKMANSVRFGSMVLNGYSAIMNPAKEEQFAALAISCGDGSVYLSFRGTDDSIVGWKEDMNLSFLEEVPAQVDALLYAQEAADFYPMEQLRIGGHSKGGNLTVYTAVHLPEEIQNRIIAAYNNDGPGFSKDIQAMPEHRRVATRIHSYVPQNSIIGMLLQHEEVYQVVKSDAVGLYQHDGFSWQVVGTQFVHLDDLSDLGKVQRQTIQKWIAGMDTQQRIDFSSAVFDLLSSNNAKNLIDLDVNKWKTLKGVVNTFSQLDKDSKENLLECILQLVGHSVIDFNEDYAQPKMKLFWNKMQDRLRNIDSTED